MPVGGALFSGFSSALVLRCLRSRLASLGVPSAELYRTHDFRRGHAQDLLARGATLREILEAGGWRSPAFLRYLDLVELEREAVVEAHLLESDSDGE